MSTLEQQFQAAMFDNRQGLYSLENPFIELFSKNSESAGKTFDQAFADAVSANRYYQLVISLNEKMAEDVRNRPFRETHEIGDQAVAHAGALERICKPYGVKPADILDATGS